MSDDGTSKRSWSRSRPDFCCGKLAVNDEINNSAAGPKPASGVIYDIGRAVGF
jgi:hypothetical protein